MYIICNQLHRVLIKINQVFFYIKGIDELIYIDLKRLGIRHRLIIFDKTIGASAQRSAQGMFYARKNSFLI